ncbi:MAG: glycosyltransferase family 4 protein [Actinomycetia bacterium]|nr:glycosyltransferase family 4 protein [Actinomycetes bacterium]
MEGHQPATAPARSPDGPSVAIVHDFLVERGGAERVAAELLEVFPSAPVYTVCYWPSRTYRAFRFSDVRPLAGAGRVEPSGDHRKLLPLALARLSALRLDYDLVIANSSGLAHLARPRSGKKFVYCNTPARWLYRPQQYFRTMAPGLRGAIGLAAPLYSRLDKRRMRDADRVAVNARVIRNEVHSIYGIRAEILHPASALDRGGPHTPVDLRGDFFLTPSRLLGYKRVDLINEAARLLPDRQFVVVGDGPLRAMLETGAPSNVCYLGVRSDSELRWLYQHCERVVLTCAEDYGLVPAEAAAFGRTSVVPDARGFCDVNGGHEATVRYSFGQVRELVTALLEARTPTAVPADLRVLQKQFRAEIQGVAAELLGSDLP